MSDRPKTRGECPTSRPCPWVSCRYNTALQVMRNGRVEVIHPDPSQWGENCSLDHAARGGMTLEEVAAVLGIVRERVRQIQEDAFDSLKASSPELQNHLEALVDKPAPANATIELTELSTGYCPRSLKHRTKTADPRAPRETTRQPRRPG